MRNYLPTCGLLLLLVAGIGCENKALDPAWKITGPRIIALQADQPVFSPGDTVTFSMLLAGVNMAERDDVSVIWRLGNEVRELPVDRVARYVIPVEDAAADVDIFGTTVWTAYKTVGHAVVDLQATVRMGDGTTLPARKSFLLAKKSVALQYDAPQIDRILVAVPGHSGLSVPAGETVRLPAGASDAISIEASLADGTMPSGYRWYLESTLPDGDAEILSGATDRVMKMRMPQLGAVIVYLVVEDRSEEVGSGPFSGGIDAVSFFVSYGTSDADDRDVLPTDSDLLLTD